MLKLCLFQLNFEFEFVYWPFLVVRPAESISSSFFLNQIYYFNNFHWCVLCFLLLTSSYSVEKLYCFYVRYQLFHLLSSRFSLLCPFVVISFQFSYNAIGCDRWLDLLRKRGIPSWVLCPSLQNRWLWYIQYVSG
jgi:hypothetical protein